MKKSEIIKRSDKTKKQQILTGNRIMTREVKLKMNERLIEKNVKRNMNQRTIRNKDEKGE